MTWMRALAVLLALGVLGCEDSPNTIHTPIGSRCSSNDACGTKPYNCLTMGHPGGYCQKDCATDGDCPTDSLCIALECRRKCSSAADCRASEGYGCIPTAVSPVCDVASSDADGGI
jgi:hypothetical protein